ncbi:hypothetical protein Ccrd_014969 [Cynara cardunculus var. scolymus]|uniref:RING-type E3 ubiquitin transferase n=1 Tax=Cynara cardunculus var. scolymus TaxID=59895 RepID=A0A124SGK7_CYNCS|nr:hypothetical protein Ccrd_014969 [Cynara cardunculus var. scolymus]
MQGQKGGSIGSLPETLGLEHGYTSSESSSVVEQQICWNNYIRNPPANYISPTNTSDMHTNQESQNVSMWTMGESSSSSVPNQVGLGLGLGQGDHGWPPLMKETHQHEPPAASMLSLGDVNMNITHNHANNGHHDLLFVQTTAPHNVTVNPSTSIGIKPSNHAETYVGSNTTSSTSFSNPLGRQLQLPSKRKAVELGQGSSSGVGSSSMFQRPEGSTSIWRSVTERSPPVNVMHSDQIIPRLGLGVPSDNHAVENTSRRNVRIRINASRQQDPLPLPATNNSNLQSNLSAPFPSLRLNPVDLRSSPPVATTVENSSSQPTLQLPALRRNLQVSSRWSRSLGSSRANRPANIDISGDYIRTNISDHPIFVQPNDIRNAAINWSLNGGGGIVGNNGNGDAASTRTRSNSVPAASSNLGPHRSSPSRRLSEIIRQSLLSSSIDSGGGGGQGSNLLSRIPPAAGTPSQVGRHHHLPHPRSSERQLDGAFGFPYLARSGAAGSEGRGRLVSEIRNVLDLIRRGEGLRFEELLALEERIGSVNTGLTEETISGCLKQKTYATVPDAEPCCICQVVSFSIFMLSVS